MQHLTNTGLDDNGIFTTALGSMQPLVPQIMGVSSSDTHLHLVSEKKERGQKEEGNKVFSLNAMKAYGGSRSRTPVILHLGMQGGG